ncbi:MAG: ABC transporter permease [Ardenticatenaceae bacterium]|nr:ABC transporter permease [Ardenticatenaceae bacterium]
MFRNIVDIAALYLRTTYSSRAALIFQLVMPLVFTAMTGVATGGFAPSDEAFTGWPLAVAVEDEAELAADFVARLAADPALAVQVGTREAGITAVADEDVVAALTIPASFSQSLLAGDDVTLDFYTNADQVTASQPVEQAVMAVMGQMQASLIAAEQATQVAATLGLFDAGVDQRLFFDESMARAENAWQQPPVTVVTQEETELATADNQIPVGINQSSPGMMVMFAMFTMLGGAITLIQERQEGTLRRLLVMPIRKVTVLSGKLSGVFITGLLQIIILIVAGILLFSVPWGQSPAALVLMILAFALATTSLGMMMAALTRTPAQANSLNTVVVLVFASLGGAWWPLEIVPTWMQALGKLFPTYWAMTGFHDIITRGLGVTAVLPEVAVLVAYGIIFLAIGTWRFRYE